MRWLICSPVLACPAIAALSAAALAQGGNLALLALVLAMTLAPYDAARSAQNYSVMPRLLRRLLRRLAPCGPCGPYLPGAAPGAGWLFGQAQDGTALATMVLCTLLATLALLPAYHALVCTPEAS